MNGELSQLVTLSSAANGVIAECLDPDSISTSHAEFSFCNSIRFVDLKRRLFRKPREVERHKNPSDWLRSIARCKTARVGLTYRSTGNFQAPDHILSAFVGGGGDWLLVVVMDERTEFWMPRCSVTNKDAADRRIWGITYACVGTLPRKLEVPEPDLKAAASRLHSVLSATRDFAAAHQLEHWADVFQKAIDCFNPAKPIQDSGYADHFVCLESYPEIAQRLFSAAYVGWVFGGMGSWNDQWFSAASEHVRYEELSAELYAAICDAIQQATWSFGGKNT